jgi:CheY-like chemotaxis protein
MKNKLNCILIIDDDTTTNLIHKMILEQANVAENILVALNGKEALDLIRNAGNGPENNYPLPDLILLDINMPIMNGWEFIEEYQKLDNGLKSKMVVVMLTCSLNPDDEIKAGKLPAINGFRNKPLSVEIVYKLVQDYFNCNNF